MLYITVSDLHLGLTDLFENKSHLIEKSMSFRIYGPMLQAKREIIGSLHHASEGIPVSEALAYTDRIHDSTGRAIFYICMGLEQLVILDGDQRNFVSKVSAVFAPNLQQLKRTYEDEAVAARAKRIAMEEMRDALSAFPVCPGTTLLDLVTTHVEAGERLDELLSKQAEESTLEAVRTDETKSLRGETIGLLIRFRQALADEASANPELPDDLEEQVFAYFNELADSAAGRAERATAPILEGSPTAARIKETLKLTR
jgi:hypothetical protein